MARARAIDGLSPEEPFAAAARRIVAVRSDEVAGQCARLKARPGPTVVHDVRVACRRLRAVLEIFEPCFEPKAHRRALRDVKRLAGDLGARRDLDVQIALVSRQAKSASAADKIGIDSLLAALRAERRGCDERVQDAVERVASGELAKSLARLEGAVPQ